ncbi:Uncharacterised protein [Proteus mirabilis]|uniref:Uncharacterized protein n=1 Tax=Proteus mirabilis TaxID=584 RepID=A0A2X2BF36_PROMI|nr:Uncharacterised protein [Proteus mirabilis]
MSEKNAESYMQVYYPVDARALSKICGVNW